VCSLGAEPYLFALLLVLCLSLFFHGCRVLAGFAAGLLYLTRGEGILVLLILVALTGLRGWRERNDRDVKLGSQTLQLVAGFAGPALIWSAYAQMTFGSILPNTLRAKQAQGQTVAQTFIRELAVVMLPRWSRRYAAGQPLVISSWWLSVATGAVSAAIARRRWLVFVAWMTLYIAGYTALGVPAYWWYYLPILFVLELLFALGVIAGVNLLAKHVRRTRLKVFLSLALVGVATLTLARSTVDRAVHYRGDIRGESYTRLSEWLRRNTDRSDSVAFIEIGYLGYYTDNKIVDLAGLVTPDVLPYVAQADFCSGFWGHLPDYYIDNPDFDWALACIRADARFTRRYRAVATLAGPSDADIVIYERTY
jgi:hypothetical protein